ncbi:glucose 1-dehydrogenase [uncultured Chitinophaga sp.]|jgi:Dehydrogenases with different specificities (related to short-chain alcohol dehydrogenases)|uniref:glucose 1-dehydrogenase n=1 Tax=uncultured Chitinophaga sp. TaxID=339340 RepID=UPI0026336E03|nr:glucose 1-dehydrogenase [uncultured Chitinophaga sp.]
MSQLQNKVALITGANSGIGYATAAEFLAQGAKVIITGRKEAAIKEAVASLGNGVEGFVADQSKLQDAEALAKHVKEKYGSIDILFVNAGIAPGSAFSDASESHFDEVMNINFKGAFFTTQKLLPVLKDGGALIFLSSVVANSGLVGMAVYNASKAALNSLARTLTHELAPRGIRVNAVNPGPIRTAILAKDGRTSADAEVLYDQFSTVVPLKRIGNSEEVAKLVTFLASDNATYISGAEVNIDGGMGVNPIM